MHCDFAFYVGATRENTRDLGELERLPGTAGVKVFMGSSTGSLLIEDDDGVRAVLQAIRRRAAFHSEDEYRLRERINLRVEGDPRSHPVWRDAQAALMCTQRLIRLAREPASACMYCMSPPRKKPSSSPITRTSPRRKRRPRISRSPRRTATRARYARPAQSADPRRRASRRDLWRGIAQGVIDSIGSDHSPHTREEKSQLYPKTHSGMTGVADTGPDHARPRQYRPPVTGAPGRSHQRGAGARIRNRQQGPHRGRLRRRPHRGRSKRRETITDRWSASRGAGRPMTASP